MIAENEVVLTYLLQLMAEGLFRLASPTVDHRWPGRVEPLSSNSAWIAGLRPQLSGLPASRHFTRPELYQKIGEKQFSIEIDLSNFTISTIFTEW